MSKKHIYYLIFSLLMIILLYMSSYIHYLLFHTLVEIVPIIIAMVMFVITINTMKYMQNKYLVFIGITYFFIAILDLFHTLTFSGMPIFENLNYPANQFWIAARFSEAVMYIVAFTIIFRKKSINIYALLVTELIILTLVLFSILSLEIFPVCYVAGVGQTTFKIIMEYVIIFLLLIALISLIKKREEFTKRQLRLYLFAILFTMLSEVSFTLYISNYGSANMIGHFFKLFSFALVYMNVIHEGLNEPLDHIFKELEKQRKMLSKKVILDELTQVVNRRGIFEKADLMWQNSIKEQQKLTVLMIDIDNFKMFNDLQGHIKGDTVLKDIATILKQLINPEKGFIGRYGGEEFLIIQKEEDYEQTQKLAESLLEAIRKLNILIDHQKKQIVTISIGFVLLTPSEKLSFEDALELADKQLYIAKNNNKDCYFGKQVK